MGEHGTAIVRARVSTRRRQEEILSQVREGNYTIGGLAEFFGISESTVRRDLTDLAAAGRVVRTYGGAATAGHVGEPTLGAKQATHRREKESIGLFAASLVSPGDLVLLDAGTTVGQLAHCLRGADGITVATNSLSALMALIDADGVEVIVLGGRLRRPNDALLGIQVSDVLNNLHPDVAFLGADGLDPVRGVNCPSLEQALVKERMAATAREAYVLADHSKLGSETYPYWAGGGARSRLITGQMRPDQRREYEQHGWAVQTADAAAPDCDHDEVAGDV